MEHKKRIAIIILNFNSSDHTHRCLESIYKQSSDLFDLSVVVVDNNSSPADRQKLASIPQITSKLIYSDKNLGFSGGMMLGAKNEYADYYFLLNNDCLLQDGSLMALYEFMERYSTTALCSGSMLDVNGKPRSSFNYFPSLLLMFLGSSLLRRLHPQRYPDRRSTYSQPVPVDVVTGAAMFVRGTVFRELNGLDTGYFLYCEEEDFARRVRMAGFSIYHVPQAQITHIGGASSNDPGLRAALNQEYYISLFRYLRKFHSSLSVGIFRLAVTLKLLKRLILGKASLRLLVFVLRGAPEKASLRYKQSTR